MSDTLYLQLDQNIEVTNPHVYLQDIAALSMSDPKILNRLRVLYWEWLFIPDDMYAELRIFWRPDGSLDAM